jgi:filamentous hemagglutinin
VPSTTFDPGSPAFNNALAQATDAIKSSALPNTVKQQALSNLQNGNFTTNTVGSGAWRNSVQVRFCGGNPC